MLYLVAYQTHWETHVELARSVVQASDEAEAVQALIRKFNLPTNKTEFKAELIEDGVRVSSLVRMKIMR